MPYPSPYQDHKSPKYHKSSHNLFIHALESLQHHYLSSRARKITFTILESSRKSTRIASPCFNLPSSFLVLVDSCLNSLFLSCFQLVSCNGGKKRVWTKSPQRRQQIHALHFSFLFFNSNYHLVNILPCVNGWLIVSTNLMQLLKHNVQLSSIFVDLFLTFFDLL